jgi:antibiotic biosynthesis monooxygenase (ABM) superfamily enzyme
MTKIDKAQPLVTLITVHFCKPEDQQQLVDVLLEAVNTTYQHLPGFISANIHKSLDGVRVTNYAQNIKAAKTLRQCEQTQLSSRTSKR